VPYAKETTVLTKKFENDIKKEIHRISKDLGIKVRLDDKLNKVLRDYLTVRFKLIDIKKRDVFFNPSFLNNLENHPQKNIINYISDLAKNGGNLNVFQSKRLLQTKFHDHLSSEWNIHHFHLSKKLDKKTNFVKQVNSLLFAYIDDEKIIFLGTEKHKEGIFADTRWIEVLHDYFPKVIEKYKDKSILEISPELKPKDRQMLWDKGYTLGFTKIRDTVYFNPGCGRMTSGHSSTVADSEISILRWMYDLTKQIDENEGELRKLLHIEKANFRIQIRRTFELIEQNTGKKILEYPQRLIIK
jgi:hypothetical protein